MRKRHIDKPTPAAAPPPAPDAAGRIYTIPELAKRWRTSRHTITAAIRAHRLQAFKVGERVYRIREAEVLRYEQQHLTASEAAS